MLWVVFVFLSERVCLFAGLMGGSRILQAIARDRIFPGVAWAGRGFGSGDEPRLAVLLTAAIAQGTAGRLMMAD
jgi:potassium/chloride transporter 9